MIFHKRSDTHTMQMIKHVSQIDLCKAAAQSKASSRRNSLQWILNKEPSLRQVEGH